MILKTKEMITHYRMLRNVTRLSGVNIHRPYNLMEHQYMVTMLFMHFAPLEDVAYDMGTVKMLLHHDILEVATGDLSYVVKNLSDDTQKAWETIEEQVLLYRNPELTIFTDKNFKSIVTPLQFDLFKAVDLLELWIFCKEEEQLGNRSAGLLQVIKNCEEFIPKKFQKIQDFILNYKNEF